MPQISAYHHLSLSVTDLARSVDWYRNVLGFEVVAEIEGTGFQRVRLRAPGDGPTLTLTAHEEVHAERFDERRPGMDHVSFQVSDIAAWADRFARSRVERSEVKAMSSGAAMITLRDPDGIQLEVFDPSATPPPASG